MKRFINKLMSPVKYFINDSRTVGVLLIACTIISLYFSNASSGIGYRSFWISEFAINSTIHLPHNVLEWINNFLMSFFFLMAGTEIKRELVEGELSTFKKAVLPFGAALGGMIFPALIFVLFNLDSGHISGWGIPTATDIAFSLGVASLLGKRVPLNLKIFLMALAIIDDLGAIVVIALFYGNKIYWTYLLIAASITGLLYILNIKKVKFGPVQILLGFCLWYSILQSGIEASIAGVVFAFTLPVNKLVAVERFIHNPVNFFILPLFALANTAITIPSAFGEALSSSQGLGIMAGLVLGKPIGIFLVSRLLVLMNVASLPTNIHWQQVLGMGTLAGIGFTMSIFTTMLAFGDELSQDISKMAVLVSMVLSVVISSAYFWYISVTEKKRVTVPAHHKPELRLNLSGT